MKRPILNKYVDLIGHADVLHALRESDGRHVVFLGAGISAESQVPLAKDICNEIRSKLLTGRDVADSETWARENLAWNDDARRYITCLDKYGSASQRVTYFRRLLKDARPAFVHHAVAMLMTRGILFETALTTNFDKLLERAFLEQGTRECQAIRTEDEAEYWVQESDKCYVFKLHGDYDTHNILNTQAETRSIRSFFYTSSINFLRGRGLLVLGSAGNEESIVEFIKRLVMAEDRQVLAGGIRWGVFVGARRPEGLSDAEELKRLETAIESGGVSRQIVELLSDVHDKSGDRRPCSFFPVWGSGNLLLSLVNSSGQVDLVNSAQLLLDHNMRLHATFRAQKLNADVIESHIRRLEEAQKKVGADATAGDRPIQQAVMAISPDGVLRVRVAYGDVTSTSTMSGEPFHGRRRAIVSPEDTTVSAGGGVALRLLTKAGARQLLNELSKLSPLAQGSCAATSAGALPVHYILHAAALRILPDGAYDITIEQIRSAATSALELADALGVQALWIPLLGAGVASVPAEASFAAILESVATLKSSLQQRDITIVIYQESILDRERAREWLQKVLPSFTATEA